MEERTGNNWDQAGRPVLGHLCPGLERFQAREGNWNYGCTPIFDEDGACMGCDATNYFTITHCPFCGIKLKD